MWQKFRFSSKWKYGLLFVAVALLMALLMGSQPTLSVLAVGETKEYVSDVMVVTEDQVANLPEGYKVLENPLYEGKRDGQSKTYLAYKTTEKANEAITDMRLMSMNGGWSFSEYDEYLQQITERTDQLIDGLWQAIVEYRLRYRVDKTKQAIFAHDALNLYWFDPSEPDEVKEFGAKMRVGDLLLDRTKINGKDSKWLKILFMESNGDVISSIYSSLSIACSRDEVGMTFIDRLKYINPIDYYEATEYNDAVYALMDHAERLRESVEFYLDPNVKKYEDFNTDEERDEYCTNLLANDYISFVIDENENRSNSDMWTEGCNVVHNFQNIPYHGIDLPDCETLLDFIRLKDVELYQWYPLVASLTDGNRATIVTTGLLSFVLDSISDENHLYDNINEIKADPELRPVFEAGISVFYGVDRNIYKDHMVAMTSEALRENATGDTSWQQAQQETDEHNQFKHNMLLYASFGLTGYTALGAVLVPNIARAMIMNTQDYMPAITNAYDAIYGWTEGASLAEAEYGKVLTQTSKFKNATKIQSFLAKNNPTKWGMYQYVVHGFDSGYYTSSLTKIFTAYAFSIVLSFVALIVTLVLFFVLHVKEEVVHEDYIEIPAMLCDYRKTYETDEDTGEVVATSKEYIYYTGAKNVNGTVPLVDLATQKDLPQNLGSVQDIYNWELGGNRQWLGLYTTKDRRAGFPILASSLKICDSYSEGSLTEFKNQSLPFDFTCLYNASIDSLRLGGETDNYKDKTAKYLHYEMDLDAVYEKTAEEKILEKMNTRTASAVSKGSAWAIGVCCAGGGVGLGFLGCTVLSKKTIKKKETVANSDDDE